MNRQLFLLLLELWHRSILLDRSLERPLKSIKLGFLLRCEAFLTQWLHLMRLLLLLKCLHLIDSLNFRLDLFANTLVRLLQIRRLDLLGLDLAVLCVRSSAT